MKTNVFLCSSRIVARDSGQVLAGAAAGLLMVAGGLLQPADAAVSYVAEGVISDSALPSDVAVGDTFRMEFTMDETVTDTNPDSTSGRDKGEFIAALSDFNFTITTTSLAQPYAGGSVFGAVDIKTFEGDTSNFDDLSFSFGEFDLFGFAGLGDLDDPPEDFFVRLLAPGVPGVLTDNGTGDTLDTVLGGPLNLTDWSEGATITFGFLPFSSVQGVISSLVVPETVPEPSRVILLVIGLGWAAMERRRGVVSAT